MAYYSQDAIEEVLSNTDIVEIIGGYVALKRRGANYLGLCPFHREKTPSFTVAPDKQIFKCFGCSEGGTVLQFIMKIENLDFKDALEFLADKQGIDLNRFIVNRGIGETSNKDLKDRIFELNKDAAMYFHEALLAEVKREKSILKEYLKKRLLDINVITRFGLGYGNKKEEGLFSYLLRKNYSKEEILKAGVVTLNTQGKVYENFSGRLIFPIFDTRDRVIGFGGRVLDNSLPKYVNSPENVVYHKGRNLYAMNIAKREKLDNIIMVEGYMDTVALHKSLINNCVASLGTALTENQAKLIRKYTDIVIIAYDQDNAGKAATLRAIDILYKEGLKVKILVLDHNDVKDPDEYLNKYGKDRFLECVKNSVNHVEYKIKILEISSNQNDMDTKIEFLNKVANILASIGNNIERDMHILEICNKYKISRGALEAEINKKLGNSSNFQLENVTDLETIVNRKQSVINKKRKQEMYILSVLFSKERKYINKIKNIVKLNDFENEDLKDIYEEVLSLDGREDISKINILNYITNQDKINIITEIMCINVLDKDKFFVDLESEIKLYRYDKRREYILNRLKENISEDEKQMLSIELSQIIINKGKLR